MIDTNTVNFAIGKMGDAISAAAPTLKNVSEMYVKFIVSQEIAHALIALVITVLCSIGVSIFWVKKTEWGRKDNVDIFVAVATVLVLIPLSFLFIQSYEAFLAYTNPEMWTVQKLINSVK